MLVELYDYQEKTANDIFTRMKNNDLRGAYIAYDTGCGKTFTALSVAERLYNAFLIHNVIVICPVSKVDDWKRDLKNEVPQIKETIVTSFQSAWRDKNSKQINKILGENVGILIVDEGHKMKTYDSKQSKYIQKIVDEYKPYTLILSATPQNKKYIDLYPQYKSLGHPLFDIKPKEFKQKYCIEAQNWNLVRAGKSRFPFNEIVGYRETEKMDKAINEYTYYKKYESEYGAPIEIPQLFKMTSDMRYFKEKKVWPKMDEKALEEKLKSGNIDDIDTDFIIANRPTLHHIYMRESCSGFIYDKILKDNPKLQWLEDFLDGNEGRIVIFTNFVNETILISELCKKMKRPYCIYDGSHKDLAEWNMYENAVAIVNVVAGGVGLNAFIKTNIAIFFSPPENHIDFEQAKGRCFLSGNLVLTPFGYRPIERIRKEDFVFDKDGQIVKVLNTFHTKELRNDLIQIQIKGFPHPIKVTSNHKFLINGEFKVASELKIGDSITLPNQNEADDTTMYPEYIDMHPFNINYYNRGCLQDKRTPFNKIEQIKIDDDFMYFIGYYLGDGCITSENVLSLSGNIDRKKSILETITKYLTTKLGLSVKSIYSRPNSRSLEYRFARHPIIDMISLLFGKTHIDKHAPFWIYNLNQSLTESLVRGLLDSDGYKRIVSENKSEYYEFVTTTNFVASIMVMSLYKLGYKPSVKYIRHDDIKQYNRLLMNNNGKWSISFTKQFSETRLDKQLKNGKISDIKKIVTRTVNLYDLETETHTYIVNNAVVHNCDRIGQTKQPVYYYLQIMHSVEPAIYRNLKEGRDFDDKMFNDWLEGGAE